MHCGRESDKSKLKAFKLRSFYLTQRVWKKMERKHWKRKIILNNNEGSEEKETLYNTYPDFKKQPWVSLLSKSENRLSSFLEVLQRNCPGGTNQKNQPVGPQGVRPWGGLWERGRWAPGLRGTLTLLLAFAPRVCRHRSFIECSSGSWHELSVLRLHTLGHGCCTHSLVSLAAESWHRFSSVSVFQCPTICAPE